MNRSHSSARSLAPGDSAPQHGRSPRPLPLFLELVRQVSEREPELARAALDGLAAYERAERAAPKPVRPEVAHIGPATLHDHGGSGPPVILVPSLINPPHILDLDEEVSLAIALARMGRHVLLLDWGSARQRNQLSVSGHIEHLLVPLIRTVGEPAALVGYCLGGTMAIAAANLTTVERVVTLAAPWRFAGYPERSRSALAAMWQQSRGAAVSLGALPMEVLQAAFWSLDPERTVAKFAEFARLDDARARRFVALEDWANEGEPLPCPAASELIEQFFGVDRPGRAEWRIAGREMSPRLAVPALHLTASRDRITPSETAPEGETVEIGAGHVGMIVGKARGQLHAELSRFLSDLAADGSGS